MKDPSLVYAHGAWHLFFTARSKEEYTTGYVSAPDLSGLQHAPRHELNMIRGKSRYGCAPQVFYYEPQGLWYLLFQNRDANYQPGYTKRRITRAVSHAALETRYYPGAQYGALTTMRLSHTLLLHDAFMTLKEQHRAGHYQ